MRMNLMTKTKTKKLSVAVFAAESFLMFCVIFFTSNFRFLRARGRRRRPRACASRRGGRE